MARGTILVSINALIWLLLTSNPCSHALRSDIDCLQAVKASLKDPLNYLSNWNFNNNTEGFICKFPGVNCWHPDENKVLSIDLSGMGLVGEFPVGLGNCTALTGVDLSKNKLYGSIPSNISEILKYATSLDLSSNDFSGTIPKGLANCSFLNSIKLDDNQLTGHIPPELSLLARIMTFSVANNRLSGPVPSFNFSISADSYANNLGLCGEVLPACKKSNSDFKIGVAVTVGALALIVFIFFVFRTVSRKKKDDNPDGNNWGKSIKGAKGIKLFMFEKSVSKIKLSDLMKATNSFSEDHIIGTGRTGTMYRAQLDDGTSLMVKRLQNTQHSKKEFISVMTNLGNVKHNNLVPLLGFCVIKKERLLVYQYMANGSLHDRLHLVSEGNNPMDWTLRLKIGITAAKGFAWLHHNCNPGIIHRNVSSKCILLDSDFEPKIFDFGPSMKPVHTQLSNFEIGEFGDLGYVAPECAATPKADVYSFGVVLLELVTGEKSTYISKAPEFKGSLVEWITQLSSNSNLEIAIDENLVTEDNNNEIFQFLEVARNCVNFDPKERPTMLEVYHMLRDIGERYSFTSEVEILMP